MVVFGSFLYRFQKKGKEIVFHNKETISSRGLLHIWGFCEYLQQQDSVCGIELNKTTWLFSGNEITMSPGATAWITDMLLIVFRHQHKMHQAWDLSFNHGGVRSENIHESRVRQFHHVRAEQAQGRSNWPLKF